MFSCPVAHQRTTFATAAKRHTVESDSSHLDRIEILRLAVYEDSAGCRCIGDPEENVTRAERVALKALCVGRHPYLSDHFGQFFRKHGVDAMCVVGIDDAIDAARTHRPDVVFCEYDLLATVPLEPWERDQFLSRVPVIAVSLTRRSDEMHLLDVNNIAGFFYLPSLTPDDARRLLHAVRPSAGYTLLSSLDRNRTSSAPTGNSAA
jgi:hypothetical protein